MKNKRILFITDRDNYNSMNEISHADDLKNLYGGNTGNMLFQYAIQKLLCDKPDIYNLQQFYYGEDISSRINSDYDCLVFAPANLLSVWAIKELSILANRFSKIKIPIICISLGATSDSNYNKDFINVIREPATAFLKSILDTGTKIGLRGYFSLDVVKELGFSESDFQVIGCPSLFIKGRNLRVAKAVLKEDELNPIFNGFRFWNDFESHKYFNKYKKSIFVCQDEFFRLMCCPEELWRQDIKYISNSDFINLRNENRIKIYGDFFSWYNEIREENFNFSYGCRFHGNIMPILNGFPSFIDSFDSRTRELAEYFEIPNRKLNKNPDPYELYQECDFSKFNIMFAGKYDDFEKFMNINGLKINSEEEISGEYKKNIVKDIPLIWRFNLERYRDFDVHIGNIDNSVESMNKRIENIDNALYAANKHMNDDIEKSLRNLDFKSTNIDNHLANMEDHIRVMKEEISKNIEGLINKYEALQKENISLKKQLEMLSVKNLKNLKICFVAQEFGRFPGHGGIASYLYNICKYLVENNFYVTVLTFPENLDSNSDLLEFVNFKVLPVYGDLPSKRKFIYSWLRKNPQDYVEFVDFLALGLDCVRAKKQKTEFAGSVFVTNNHTATREIYEWNNDFPLPSDVPEYETFLKEKEQLELSDYCIAPSTFLANYVKEHYHLKKDVHVFGNPFLTKLRTQDEIRDELSSLYNFEEYQDKFNIVLITRFEGRKCQARLVRAVLNLLKKNLPIRLILVGNSCAYKDTDYRSYVYRMCRQNSDILIYDFMNIKQQEKFIAISDLTVMPSTYENQPVAMIETVLRGVPVIGSKFSGVADYTFDENMLFDPFDEFDLQNKIEKFVRLSQAERKEIATGQKKNLLNFIDPEKSILGRFALTVLEEGL